MNMSNATETTQCNLLGAVPRAMDRARQRGLKSVSIDMDEFLEAMRYDGKGGMDEMEAVLREICSAGNYRRSMMTENHRQVITFVHCSSGIG
jgi:hypothetical protein